QMIYKNNLHKPLFFKKLTHLLFLLLLFLTFLSINFPIHLTPQRSTYATSLTFLTEVFLIPYTSRSHSRTRLYLSFFQAPSYAPTLNSLTLLSSINKVTTNAPQLPSSQKIVTFLHHFSTPTATSSTTQLRTNSHKKNATMLLSIHDVSPIQLNIIQYVRQYLH
ncbi:hypothetical protein, partial [Basilea psittacipulmonis]|uniref:hypothetical protein n=1 Tax=Basilea psittacipulmonis TaxID=1472345 RepID=UPI001F318460